MYPKVYVISVSVRSIAGRHKMTEEDYGLPPGTLPPEDLATLGNLITVDPELLKEPERLRKRTDRILKNGVKVGVGAVFTEGQLKDTHDQLESIKVEYEQAIQTIIDNFEDSLEARITEHSKYGDLIRKYAPDVSYVKRRMGYDINVCKLAVPVDDPHADVLAKTLKRGNNDISKRLIEEVAEAVVKFHKASFQETKKLVKQSVNKLKNKLLPKIQSFALLDASLKPVWCHLDAFVRDVVTTIDAQPKGEAWIEGDALVPFETRIKHLMTTRGIQSLIETAPAPTGFPATPATREASASPEKPPAVAPLPKRPAPVAPSSDGRRQVRRISF